MLLDLVFFGFFRHEIGTFKAVYHQEQTLICSIGLKTQSFRKNVAIFDRKNVVSWEFWRERRKNGLIWLNRVVNLDFFCHKREFQRK